MMWNSDEEDDDVGIHFAPTDEELIKDYLIQKIGNKSFCGGEYIVYKDVYAKEPWLLDHNNKDNFFEENEWYYFSTRTQVSELKIGYGKNTKRSITGGGNGYWKANNHVDIIDEETGKPIGRKQTLTFKKSKNKKKKQKIGDDNNNTTTTCVSGSDSSWIMDEYLLGGNTTTMFQELVICKIKEKKKKNSKMEVEDDASCGDGNMAHQSNDQFEPEQIVEDDQLLHSHNVPLSHDSYLPIQEQEGEAVGCWIQDLDLDLLMMTSNDQALDYNSSANICV